MQLSVTLFVLALIAALLVGFNVGVALGFYLKTIFDERHHHGRDFHVGRHAAQGAAADEAEVAIVRRQSSEHRSS